VTWPWVALAALGGVPLVDVTDRLPEAVVELRYATSHNVTHRPLYPVNARCRTLPRTLEALVRAQAALRPRGYRLKFYDCYRPQSVQVALWQAQPLPGYVMDPRKGSTHSRGTAVDVTLVDARGRELEMPSGYDVFGPAAHHGYQGGSARARANRAALREAMERAGFRVNPYEWWHYEAPDAFLEAVRDEPVGPSP
jgi:D-alanyl-D-alanine dipeptidase